MNNPLSVQVLLLLLDKLVLGGILAGAVLFGQRWLENYKARQTLVQGLVKLRIDEISELCVTLAKIELELNGIDAHYQEIITQQAPIVARSAPKGDFRDLFADAVDRIATPELVPRLEKVGSDLTGFAAQVAPSMFWIPEGVTRLLKEHAQSLDDLCKLQHERITQKKFVPISEVEASSDLASRKRLTLDTVLVQLRDDA